VPGGIDFLAFPVRFNGPNESSGYPRHAGRVVAVLPTTRNPYHRSVRSWRPRYCQKNRFGAIENSRCTFFRRKRETAVFSYRWRTRSNEEGNLRVPSGGQVSDSGRPTEARQKRRTCLPARPARGIGPGGVRGHEPGAGVGPTRTARGSQCPAQNARRILTERNRSEIASTLAPPKSYAGPQHGATSGKVSRTCRKPRLPTTPA